VNNRFARIAAAVLAAAALTACTQHTARDAESTTIQEDKPTMDLAQLPTLKQTRDQMLELIFAVQREVARQVPATAPWAWHYEYQTSACETDGLKLYFPKLGSPHGLTDDEWAQTLPAVTRLAAAAGLMHVGGAGQNTSGNHDARISSDDGRELVFAAREATLITASVGCRRSADVDLWVDGRIPNPPDPQP